MKQFLAIYLGAQSASPRSKWGAMDETTRKKTEAAGMQAWGEWMQKHQSAVVAQGGPLGKTRRADASGISDTRNAITGYVIVRADSHDAAAKMFENHPHFTIFPGEAVEIMECLPIPGQ